MTRIRMGLLLGLLLALGLAVAGCGGGDKPSGVASLGGANQATATTTAGGGQQELAFARCLRQHGINLPDPQFRGDGIVLQFPTREVRESPKFKAAQQACRQFLPDGGQPSPPSAREVQQALAFARCLRQHGINVPDPRVTEDGIYQQLPEGAGPNAAKFRAAEQACGQYLPEMPGP